MRFKKLSLSIPDHILAVYERINSIQKNSGIAGGFLSDLYMNRSFKDVDIFIKYDEQKKKTIEQHFKADKINSSESDYPGVHIHSVSHFKIEGIDYHFIYTKKGINAVKYFDFRFREFLYIRNHTFASLEALDDIQSKQLTFGTTTNPYSSLNRLFLFKERYNFAINETGLERLKGIVHFLVKERGLTYDGISVKPSIRHKEASIFIQGLKKETSFIVPRILLRFALKRGVKRDLFEAAYEIKSKKRNFSFSFPDPVFERFFLVSKKHGLKRLKENRIRLISHHDPTFYKEVEVLINDNLDEKTNDRFRSLCEQFNVDHSSSANFLFAYFKKCEQIIELKETLRDEPIHMRISNTPAKFSTKSLNYFVKRDLYEIDIDHISLFEYMPEAGKFRPSQNNAFHKFLITILLKDGFIKPYIDELNNEEKISEKAS